MLTKDKIQMLTLTKLVRLVHHNTSFNVGLIKIVLSSLFVICHSNYPMSLCFGFN